MPAEPGTHAVETRSRRRIGELLRETRANQGGNLSQIAADLRIRVSYLAAIEEGRYESLPGHAYALGFVRAYANYLGLDDEEAVRRFKQETVGFEAPQGLSFPVPLGARSIPGGAMLLAAAILAICGYGLWYYVSTGEQPRPEHVSAVPADLKPPEPAPPPPAAPTPAPQAAVPAAPPAVQPPADSGAASGAPPAPAAAPATPSSAAAAGLTPATGALATAAPQAAKPAAAPTTAPTQPAEPQLFGTIGGPSRIMIRARSDAWVQIRDGERILVDRVLHADDSVRVPDKPGLVMSTGNGTGIDIQVDGGSAPPLHGRVFHEIALDPDRLRAGTAVVH